MTLKSRLHDWNSHGNIADFDDRAYATGYWQAISDVTKFLRDNFQPIEIIQAIARMDDLNEPVGN